MIALNVILIARPTWSHVVSPKQRFYEIIINSICSMQYLFYSVMSYILPYLLSYVVFQQYLYILLLHYYAFQVCFFMIVFVFDCFFKTYVSRYGFIPTLSLICFMWINYTLLSELIDMLQSYSKMLSKN